MMIRSSSIAMLLLCVVCSYCGKDFVTLGRHSWRCKQRVNQAEQSGSENPTARKVPVVNSPTVVIESRTVVKCCCGKICKGTRGLKMHQRSCRVIHGLNSELCSDIEEQAADNSTDGVLTVGEANNTNLAENDTSPVLKKGINLPKRDSEWSTANEYFKSALLLTGPIKSQELNTSIQALNDVIYSYFADTFGHTETTPDKRVINKYKDYR
jgi:hypothetical protein